MNDFTSLFYMTFHGFPHAWGESGDNPHAVWEDLTLAHFRRHLDGEIPLGIYPMTYDPTNKHVGPRGWVEEGEGKIVRTYPDMRKELWVCSWGCIDIDAQSDAHTGQGTEDEVMEYAFSIHNILQVQSIPSWVERTRSGGAHIWVFADTWCSTTDMRRCLLAAEEMAGVPTDSPFPKSEWLTGPPGNFVRLPYHGKRARIDRQVVVNEQGEPLSLEDFLQEANGKRAKIADIKASALLKAEPKPHIPNPVYKAAPSKMSGALKKQYENGPPAGAYTENQGRGRGRHGWLYSWACLAFRDGHDLNMVVGCLEDMDNRFTHKFWQNGKPRHDQVPQLRNLAMKAQDDVASRTRIYR